MNNCYGKNKDMQMPLVKIYLEFISETERAILYV